MHSGMPESNKGSENQMRLASFKWRTWLMESTGVEMGRVDGPSTLRTWVRLWSMGFEITHREWTVNKQILIIAQGVQVSALKKTKHFSLRRQMKERWKERSRINFKSLRRLFLARCTRPWMRWRPRVGEKLLMLAVILLIEENERTFNPLLS